jgi:predicted nucleotidyltransferase component of viral defense system
LSSVLVFKGGNALDFFWHPNRSTMDLDFSVTGSEADQPDFQTLFSSGLAIVQREIGVHLRLQSAERRPPSPDRTWATWQLKVAYALPDDLRNRRQIEKGAAISNVVPVEISLNEVVCAVEDLALADRPFRLHVCTLEYIVAEKLRALLQQIPRNRRRGQDLLDIASVLQSGAPLSAIRVAHFLEAKARAREIAVSKSAFREPELAVRASHEYERLEDSTRSSFIP